MPKTKSPNSAASRRGTRSAIRRRPPTGGWPLVRHRVRQGWFQTLEQPWIWIGLFVVVTTWILLPQRLFFVPHLEAGDIAGQTWVADRIIQVQDEAATEQLRARAAQEIMPVYDRDRGLQVQARGQLGALFEAGRGLIESGELPGGVVPEEGSIFADESRLQGILDRLAEASTFRLEAEALGLLARERFATQMEDRLAGVMARVMRQGVVANKELLLEHRVRGITVRDLPSGREAKELDLFRYLDYPDQVREEVENDLRGWDGLRSSDRRILADLLLDNLAPNLNFNSSDTLERRSLAAEAKGAVTHTFGPGEVIVRRGARVDDLRARALGQLVGERNLTGIAMSTIGTLLLLGAGALLIWLAVGQERRRDRGRDRMLGEVLLLLTLAMVAVRFGVFLAEAVAAARAQGPFGDAADYRRAIPFAALALITVLLYGRNLGLVISLVFALLSGRLAGGDAMWEVTVYVLASCLAAIFALDQAQFRQRSMMTRAAVVVGGANALAVLALESMGGVQAGGPSQLAFGLLCGFIGGLLVAAVTSFAVPILEPLFHITTSIKLIELANPNLPLLRRLAFEAPGTFQHSLAVANLAKAGVETIEGDSVLVHTGALYHDIGKIFRPNYYIENQPPGQNPHDKIQASMSALILINHVKDGLELAEKHALPAPIIDAIEQHHGTRLIKYFYNRAKEKSDPDTEEVREEEFRYPGPKPQSKEMGVLMLADAVEAASRTLIEPSRQKIRTVLRAVFDDCLNDGQLDRTDLTLGDLGKVEEAFLRVLTNIYHRRVDYPGFDFNRRGGGRPMSEESGILKMPQGERNGGAGNGSNGAPGRSGSRKGTPGKATPQGDEGDRRGESSKSESSKGESSKGESSDSPKRQPQPTAPGSSR